MAGSRTKAGRKRRAGRAAGAEQPVFRLTMAEPLSKAAAKRAAAVPARKAKAAKTAKTSKAATGTTSKGTRSKGTRSAAARSPKLAEAKAAASPRDARKVERREAILEAALEEFAASGFAATRLDDVAKRAGVAKGTIYLYFQDKEALFEELVRSMLGPLVGTLTAAPPADLPARMIVEGMADLFVREVFGTRRKDIIRLIITEGQRFPKLAEVYYREVISRVLPVLRAVLTRAVERGELHSDALARFPQLLVAPALVGLVWQGLFGRFAPLDVRELMQANIDMIFGKGNAS